jgi:hypothetical protein
MSYFYLWTNESKISILTHLLLLQEYKNTYGFLKTGTCVRDDRATARINEENFKGEIAHMCAFDDALIYQHYYCSTPDETADEAAEEMLAEGFLEETADDLPDEFL